MRGFSLLNIRLRLAHAPARRPSAPARIANFFLAIALAHEPCPSAHAKGRVLDGGRAYRMPRRRFRAAITLTWSQQPEGSKTEHLPSSPCGRREAPTPAPERHDRATRPPKRPLPGRKRSRSSKRMTRSHFGQTPGRGSFSLRRYARHRNEFPPHGGHSASILEVSFLNTRFVRATVQAASSPAHIANFYFPLPPPVSSAQARTLWAES